MMVMAGGCGISLKILVCVCFNFRCTPLWCVAKHGENFTFLVCYRRISLPGNGCVFGRQRARRMCVHYCIVTSVEKIKYLNTGSLVCCCVLTPSRNSLSKQNSRRRIVTAFRSSVRFKYSLRLTRTAVTSSLGRFRLRANVAEENTECVPLLLSRVRCLPCNENEVNFPRSGK